jgi:hypothetical protein
MWVKRLVTEKETLTLNGISLTDKDHLQYIPNIREKINLQNDNKIASAAGWRDRRHLL